MEGDLHRWHLPDGAIARLGKGRISRGDRAIAFSPDGQLLGVGSETGTWLYDVMTSREVALLPIGKGVMSVAFSPDGSKLASARLLWDLATGSHTPLESFYSVAFSPDGTMLALGTYDSKIKLWDTAAGTTTATFEDTGVLSTQWRFRPTAQSSFRVPTMARSCCGTWRRVLMQPWRGIRTWSSPWPFLPMGRPSLPDPTTTRSDFGMPRRALISPRSRDIRAGSSPWRFRPMGKSLLPGRRMAPSDCGT